MQKDICKALGNQTRARLVSCLKKQKTVTELLSECNLSQSALSQHLKILKDNNVVYTEKIGKNIYYKTKDKKFLQLANLLLTI
jgi:DNA-binding transcriptional ArsR family regulator